MKATKKQYEIFLNNIGTPYDDLKSNGGRVSDNAKYGSWIRKNDVIAFEVGFNDYRHEY